MRQFNHVIQRPCFDGRCPDGKRFRFSFKFQRRVSLESLGLASSCPLSVILVAVLWPSTPLRSHRHARLVDILARSREVRQFSCYRTAGLVLFGVSSRQSYYSLLGGMWGLCNSSGSLGVPHRHYGATNTASSLKYHFILPSVSKVREKQTAS